MTAPTIKTCPNGLRKTILVSFPRSGHHLLVRGLTEALDHKLVYSEYYTCAHNMSNCEYVNLQKSHDFDLTDPIDPELNYIVLTREFEPAMKSWWKATNSELTINEFKDSKKEYYQGFRAKWDISGPNILTLNYFDFFNNSYLLLANCVRLMGGEINDSKTTDFLIREELIHPALAGRYCL